MTYLRQRLAARLYHRLRAVAQRRAPDFIIGSAEAPYLRRWWLIPRNPLCNVYLHEFLRSDEDRALHDHPWWNLTFLLRGAYIEHHPAGRFSIRHAGDFVFRSARTAHRIELFGGANPAWSLFLTGPRVRAWGFHCPAGWRPWQQFTAPSDKGAIGRGCE